MTDNRVEDSIAADRGRRGISPETVDRNMRRLVLAVETLQEIARQDYRGPMPLSVKLARAALQEMGLA